MVSMKAKYLGQKHCEITHGPSGSKIETDAPKDNQGRGEAFSPTDLVGAALLSCILTTMAMSAERDGLSLEGSHGEVSKEMSANPRRIAKLPVTLHLPKKLTNDQRKKLEIIAKGCPVHHSLYAELESPLVFIYDIH